MNSFAVLADDVEDADDFAPPVVSKVDTPVVEEVKKEVVSKPTIPERSERSTRGGFKGRGRGGFRGRGGRGGYRGGRGRFNRDGDAGGRFGRDADGGRYNRDGESRYNRDGDGGGRFARDDGRSWERRNDSRSHGEPNGTDVADMSTPAAEEDVADVKPDTGEDAVDITEEIQPEPEKPQEPADMSLDEYLAQKKAAASVGLRKGATPRRAIEVGGKMAVLKKKNDGTPGETSIMSAVSLKAAVEERAAKDSTHAAVADNAKNQEFFKSAPRERASRGGRGRGGYRRYDDDGDRRPRYDSGRRRNVRPVHAPNVDDTNAFPSLTSA